jgi:hypothetical protein
MDRPGSGCGGIAPTTIAEFVAELAGRPALLATAM